MAPPSTLAHLDAAWNVPDWRVLTSLSSLRATRTKHEAPPGPSPSKDVNGPPPSSDDVADCLAPSDRKADGETTPPSHRQGGSTTSGSSPLVLEDATSDNVCTVPGWDPSSPADIPRSKVDHPTNCG